MQNKFGIYLDNPDNRAQGYHLTVNKAYEIVEIEITEHKDTMIYIYNDEGKRGGFYSYRFKIIEGDKNTIGILYGNKNK